MTLEDFTEEAERKEIVENYHDRTISKLISDERMLRVLFEAGIFELREIQEQAIKEGLFYRKSFLVSAPSGSGKTLIGELCSVYNVFQGFGKSVYLVPFKALASEKYYDFKRKYSRFGLKVILSIGDFDSDEEEIQASDILITTYEKMDSILRNFFDKDWIHQISTVIIDEIHIIGDNHRGPRLESLIVRLNEFLYGPQIIGLSATIANPEFFNDWLTSLGNKTVLIKSDVRPVPLRYFIDITQAKDSTLKKVIKKTLTKEGQILVFLNRRKACSKSALTLKNFIKNYLTDEELEKCKVLSEKLREITGHNQELERAVRGGVGFHHAGLLPKERKYIENHYKSKFLKVICCTTTLSAGINLPARTVIVRDFKKYSTTHYNIKNFDGFYEMGDGFSYFKPFDPNEMFQMLGRAGRPGLDPVGLGHILVNDLEERIWVEEFYFERDLAKNKLKPKYSKLISALNKSRTLKEQVLLRIYEAESISLQDLKRFFERTYFWYNISHQNKQNKIPIEQFLMIKRIAPINILRLHSDPNHVKKLFNSQIKISLQQISDVEIKGLVKTDYGVFNCAFSKTEGVHCTCGFKNELNDNFADSSLSFLFCDHITVFLIHLIKNPDSKFQKYVEDIIPHAVKNQYTINYLLQKGLIYKEEDKLKCTQFGKLIIRLYIHPVSAVLIRYKLENAEITDERSLIESAYDILRLEYRVKDTKMLSPILEWLDEEPIEEICNRYQILAGDIYSLKENLERIVTFIGIIAMNLVEEDIDYQNDLVQVSDMCETMKTRIKFGIKEELFDLVLRIYNVARVRARQIYDAGFHTATEVEKVSPYKLSRKTGLGVDLCKSIINHLHDKRKKQFQQGTLA